jgi:methionyl aminopeptidase
MTENSMIQVAAKGVTVKSPREIIAMRQAGKVVALALELLKNTIEPGMRTQDLDALAAAEFKRLGAKPAFLGYRGFPATICVSLNEEIVHGIPGSRKIVEGDLVKMDVGAIVDGLYGDAAITVGVGRITEAAQKLIETTRESLLAGIHEVGPGVRLGDVGAAIQRYAEARGYSVVREYVGHGIGRRLHEDPSVPNYGIPGRGLPLRTGMAIAIEPMVNIGTRHTEVLSDEWTVVTADGELSAHFEHTMLVTDTGVEVLTVC